MKKGPFKMKGFSGFGNESPVKHNKAAEGVGMMNKDGRMNIYNPATGEYTRPGDMAFAIGSYGRTAGLQKNPRSRRHRNMYANPTGAKIF
jgi:hypothetical protein